MAEQPQTTDQIIAGWNDRLTQLADTLTAAAREYGPDAIELAFSATRVSCAGAVLLGVAFGIASYIAYRFARPRFQAYSTICKEKSDAYWANEEESHFIIGMIFSAASLVTFVISAICLLNIWNWAGMFWPQLYIAHKLLDL